GDLLERALHEQTDVLAGIGDGVDESDLLEVLRGDGLSDGVAERLVEAVIGAVLVERRLISVGQVVIVVTELVMDSSEVLRSGLNAHLHTDVGLRIDVPCAGMANDVAVARLLEERALPEGVGQLLK